MIDRAEDFIMQLGFRQVRVRQHDNLARIEVPAADLAACCRLPRRCTQSCGRSDMRTSRSI